ncbi:Fis family transcriptional regulator [Roseateles aquatilis]|uniref:Fis family transcriptional regulator n=1 Tax=Roseateles aquatilis TaxID=431061 RepID=A0A246JGV6_9BURK|nr:sigma-54 dependent transcriptional regulator [Roseateles aquatilis]OWQ91867.1 Fis family transcriptional regulator [Roseateles aquatilis]
MHERGGENTGLLTLDGATAGPLSIRARSLAFVDPASQAVLQLIERVAPSTAPVMIGGDSGTGKELIARHIHTLSGRTGPFLAINCGAITEHLAESELFGHEAGAFTGAQGRREGWFEAAHHGTLFLDEIGDLPLSLQVKLLRVLQEREVVRLGSRKAIPVDVRLVTATNVDLSEAVSAGHFRLDLFYRLNIVQVRLPPLRERIGDIGPLARHFLSLYSRRLNLPEPRLGDAALRALEAYDWPGNIRELENVIHFALLVASEQEIRPEHLKLAGQPVRHRAPAEPPTPSVAVTAPPPTEATQEPAPDLLRRAVRALLDAPPPALFTDVERLLVEESYRHSGRNQVRAGALLGVSRNVMRTLLKRHGLIGDGTGGDGPESPDAGDSDGGLDGASDSRSDADGATARERDHDLHGQDQAEEA